MNRNLPVIQPYISPVDHRDLPLDNADLGEGESTQTTVTIDKLDFKLPRPSSPPSLCSGINRKVRHLCLFSFWI